MNKNPEEMPRFERRQSTKQKNETADIKNQAGTNKKSHLYQVAFQFIVAKLLDSQFLFNQRKQIDAFV